mmetsp:Transcript_9912/g.20610  ORF Transcript_9912/g.20610 Transcript_9912/m.20610 type:complete len:218 (+) Transcript_9912:622-1275(+)
MVGFKINLRKVGESVSGDDGSVDHSSEGNHGQTSVLQLGKLHVLRLLRIRGHQAQGIESKVARLPIELVHVAQGSQTHGLHETDPEQDLLHGSVEEGIVCVDDLGDGLEGELLAGNADEFGDDEADDSEHGLTAVFEFGLAEPVEPFGGALGETNGVKVLGGLLSEVEGHGLGTLSSHQAVGELVELSGLGRGGNGGKSGGGTGEGCEEGGGELGHG